MNKKNGLIFGFIILIYCFLSACPLHAEKVSAEIINIDQDQKIIFVDLGRDVLSVGDVMSVDGVDHPIYLEVEETSDAVSKLRTSKNEKFYSNPSELDNVTIGMKVTRVLTTQEQQLPASPQVPVGAVPTTAPTQPIANNLPMVDAQAFVKPDLAKESIQSIVDRMNTMVDGNIKLSNALSQCQADLGDSQKLNAANADLKKQIDEAASQITAAESDRDKYKKQADDLLARISELKARLDHLDSIIGEH